MLEVRVVDGPLLSCVVCFLSLSQSVNAAEDKQQVAAFSMSMDDFKVLPSKEQSSIVRGALERRLALGRNLEYDALTLGRVCEFSNGQVGKVVGRLFGRRFRHYRLGDSYRVDVEIGDVDVRQPVEFPVAGFDAKTGIVRSISRYKNGRNPRAKIDVKQPYAIIENRYNYWLDGKNASKNFVNFFVRDIVNSFEDGSAEVSATAMFVRISMPWTPPWGGDAIGTREVDLDPSKGFLPVMGEAQFYLFPNYWRIESFSVGDSELVTDVWMPTVFTESIRASSGSRSREEGNIEIWETRISEITAGKVVAEDLLVDFPEGTEVLDATTGIYYIVGPEGQHLSEQPVVGGVPQAPTSLP